MRSGRDEDSWRRGRGQTGEGRAPCLGAWRPSWGSWQAAEDFDLEKNGVSLEFEEADSGCRTQAGEQRGILQSPGRGRRGQNGQWVQGGEGRAGLIQGQDHQDREEDGGVEGVESDLSFLLLGPQTRPGPRLPAQPG